MGELTTLGKTLGYSDAEIANLRANKNRDGSTRYSGEGAKPYDDTSDKAKADAAAPVTAIAPGNEGAGTAPVREDGSISAAFFGKGGLFGDPAGAVKPKENKLPQIVDPTDEYIRNASLHARRRLQGLGGIQSTFLTGPQGVTGPAKTGRG